jgi:RHS repeat-associated protein
LFFQGRELDPVTGLYDFRNRWYSPELGRWLTPDPVPYVDSPNLYAAFLADPVNNADPTGEFVPLAFALIAGWSLLTEGSHAVAPDSLLGRASFSYSAASAVTGVDPNSGSGLSGFDRTLAGVGAAGQVVGLAGAGVGMLAQGSRTAVVLNAADRGAAAVEAGINVAAGNPVGAALSALGARGPDVPTQRMLPPSSSIITDPARLLPAPVSTTRTTRAVGDLRADRLRDAHHVVQDAAMRDIPGYATEAAPGVQLTGPSTRRGSPHYQATQVQRQRGGGTYASERRIAYKALREAGFTPDEARAAIEAADKYFQQLGVSRGTPTRIPGNRR